MNDDNREDRPSATPEWKGDHPAQEHAGERYDPSEEEITRLRLQGLGVGAQDLALQQDPTGSPPDRSLHDRINRETNEDEITRVEPRGDKRQ
ncbi:MAG TPA: hypothetical protein VEA15_06960 [Caulobacteraceae bacterium]|nr:hypothetical protein [Caulobacteraceae bacterium]